MPKTIDLDFLKSLPGDIEMAEAAFLDRLLPLIREINQGDPELASANAFREDLAVFAAWRKKHNLDALEVSNDPEPAHLVNAAISQLTDLKTQNSRRRASRQADAAIRRGEEWYAMQSGELFCYEFKDSEVEEIREHLDTLSALIGETQELEEAHKARLLRRLKQLKEELDKKVADLDRFWGLIGDARIVFKKIPTHTESAKKILETVYRIAQIIFIAQQLAHGLPAHEDHPQFFLLPQPPPALEQKTERLAPTKPPRPPTTLA
jgi:hypothetical protein